MTQNVLILGGASVVAFLLYRQRRADRQALESQTLDVLKRQGSPNIAISNVEAIEERRVFEFKPAPGQVSIELQNQATIVTDFRDLLTIGVPKNQFSLSTRNPVKSAAVVRVDAGGKNETVPLVVGAFYSSPTLMGDKPYGAFRVRLNWEDTVGGSRVTEPQLKTFSATFEVDGAIWQKCFISKIATVAEQVAVGGVFEVPRNFQP